MTATSFAEGDTIWSGNGKRVRGRERTEPLAVAGRVWRVIALGDDRVVTSGVDAKDKGVLQRWTRYTPR